MNPKQKLTSKLGEVLTITSGDLNYKTAKNGDIVDMKIKHTKSDKGVKVKKVEWRPKIEQVYWFVTIGESDFVIYRRYWDNDGYDNNKYKKGNCFRTRKLAVAAAKAIRLLLRNLPHS